jgi:hypothetical protein
VSVITSETCFNKPLPSNGLFIKICLCGNSFTNTLPSNGCTCNNILYKYQIPLLICIFFRIAIKRLMWPTGRPTSEHIDLRAVAAT